MFSCLFAAPDLIPKRVSLSQRQTFLSHWKLKLESAALFYLSHSGAAMNRVWPLSALCTLYFTSSPLTEQPTTAADNYYRVDFENFANS